MNTGDIITDTEAWFIAAIPEPTKEDFSTQFSVFMEEFLETLDNVIITSPSKGMAHHASKTLEKVKRDMAFVIDAIRSGRAGVEITDRIEFLDGLADTIVTAQASAHTADMNLPGALNEVNRSNFSKFVDGKPIFFEGTKKIGKGPQYTKPDLKGFI